MNAVSGIILKTSAKIAQNSAETNVYTSKNKSLLFDNFDRKYLSPGIYSFPVSSRPVLI